MTSNNQSPSENTGNECNNYGATSNNHSTYENEEFEHDDYFNECTVEDDNENLHVIEDTNESVNTVCLRIIKGEIIDDTSERKKGLKKDWIMKYLRDKNWLIDKKDASKTLSNLGMKCDIEECYRD